MTGSHYYQNWMFKISLRSFKGAMSTDLLFFGSPLLFKTCSCFLHVNQFNHCNCKQNNDNKKYIFQNVITDMNIIFAISSSPGFPTNLQEITQYRHCLLLENTICMQFEVNQNSTVCLTACKDGDQHI